MILSNCTKTRMGQPVCIWGKYLSRLAKMLRFSGKTVVQKDGFCTVSRKHLVKGHASQTFLRRPLKKVFSGEEFLSRSTIHPSNALHPAASTLRADADINLPYRFDQLGNGQVCIPGLETLMSLESKNQFQVLAFAPVIQEAVVTDLSETGREHVHQIAPDKLRIFQGYHPARLTGLSAPGGKGGLLFIHRNNTAVGDGDLMCIPAEILDGIAKSVEGFFDVRAPVLFVKGIAEFRPFIRISELFTGSGTCQGAAFVKGIEACEKFPFEFIPQDFNPDKEAVFYLPDFPVRGNPAAGNNTVHMYMVVKLLVPGMEYLDDAGSCSKIFFIRGKL